MANVDYSKGDEEVIATIDRAVSFQVPSLAILGVFNKFHIRECAMHPQSLYRLGDKNYSIGGLSIGAQKSFHAALTELVAIFNNNGDIQSSAIIQNGEESASGGPGIETNLDSDLTPEENKHLRLLKRYAIQRDSCSILFKFPNSKNISLKLRAFSSSSFDYSVEFEELISSLEGLLNISKDDIRVALWNLLIALGLNKNDKRPLFFIGYGENGGHAIEGKGKRSEGTFSIFDQKGLLRTGLKRRILLD